MADLTDEQIEALLALEPMYLDDDGDLCREGGGYNLISCAAVDDDGAILNPSHFSAAPDLQAALRQTHARALAAEATNAKLRRLLRQALGWNWLDAEDYDEEDWSCMPMMKMLSDDIDAALKETDND